jgi:hypothetical protein
LLHVLFEFIILVEGRGDKLLTPERNVGSSSGSVEVVDIRVLNSQLVKSGKSEGPDFILFESMINRGIIGIGRVSVEGLSLDIEEFKGFIIIIHGDGVRHTNDILALRLVGLQAFKVVNLVKGDIIHVFEDVGVLHNVLIETREGVVENRASSGSVDELLHADVETGIELVVLVLVMLTAIINASGSESTSHALVFTVSVNAP